MNIFLETRLFRRIFFLKKAIKKSFSTTYQRFGSKSGVVFSKAKLKIEKKKSNLFDGTWCPKLFRFKSDFTFWKDIRPWDVLFSCLKTKDKTKFIPQIKLLTPKRKIIFWLNILQSQRLQIRGNKQIFRKFPITKWKSHKICDAKALLRCPDYHYYYSYQISYFLLQDKWLSIIHISATFICFVVCTATGTAGS